MLTEEQSAAAKVDHSTVLLAGPGAGKTKTVVARIEHLLESGIQPEEIVVFTFTRRAAKELRDRIGPEAKRMWVGTFHSVMLDAMATVGICPSVLDAAAADAALDEVALLLGKAVKQKEGIKYLKHSRKWWRDRIDQCRLSTSTAEGQVVEFASAYTSHLRLNNDIDYAGILSTGLEVIDRTKLRSVKECIVDESQDTDKPQWRIIRTIAQWANVFAVGDQRQQIFEWRGVDPSDFGNQPWPKLALTQSFRCPPDGMDACNKIAQAAGDTSPLMQVGKIERPTINVSSLGVVDVVRKLTQSMYATHEIAVLCRYNTQVAEYGSAIQQAGMDISIAQQPPGGPVHQLLMYLAAPDSETLRAQCAALWRPYQSLGIPKVIENVCNESFSIDTCAALTRSWLGSGGVFVGPREVLAALNLPYTLTPDVRYYAQEYKDCTLEQFAREASGIYDREIEQEQRGVAVLTVHQAKGLEWPCVIVPECNNGVWPRNPEKINNEDRRVFLVAITRYREMLYLLTDSRREPSVFLKEAGIIF